MTTDQFDIIGVFALVALLACLAGYIGARDIVDTLHKRKKK